MYSLVIFFLSLVTIQYVLDIIKDYARVEGTWEIADEEWEVARPLLPALDTNKKAVLIRFLEPSFQEVEQCALDNLVAMYNWNNQIYTYFNDTSETSDETFSRIPRDISIEEVCSMSWNIKVEEQMEAM